jgi:hypothetical protein
MLNSLRRLGCYSAALLAFCASNAWAEGALTSVEMQWLRAGWPVLTYAEQQGLPIDIIAQPQAKPGDVPLAMGFDNGRCKLVLSMRGNPDAETMLANIPAAEVNAVIEAVTAHEVAHCWRYVRGVWHTLPSGFVEGSADLTNNLELAKQQQEMRETRREEGFADLVGLAWTSREHPDQYANVHAWFEQIRKNQPVAGSYHDTRVWVALAKDRAAFTAAATPFEQVQKLWDRGLLSEE